MLGYYPGGGAAIGDDPLGPDNVAGRMLVTDLPDGPSTFLVELGTVPPSIVADVPSLGQGGGLALSGAPDNEARSTITAATLLCYSDRGWIGEPGDPQAANLSYPPRLLTPPSIERSMRVLPEDAPGLTFQAGELDLDNADGALNVVGGDWTMAGRSAVLRRGPYRAPLRAPYGLFQRVAALRITSAAAGTTKLTVALQDASVALKLPVSGTYGGTGGLEGDTSLTGNSKPLLLGIKRNISPVKLLSAPASLVFQISAGGLASVSGVRDRGSALSATADYATLPALQAASIGAGNYATCLALGLIRVGSTPAGQLTCDATGANDASHAGIVLALLRGPGGLTDDRYNPAAFTAGVPGGAAGFLFTGGTVEDALDQVLTSCGGWWGSDRLGSVTGGMLADPATAAPIAGITTGMLQAQPEEVAGTAPRWRQRITYQALATVQSATDLAGIASSNPIAAAYYSTANQTATAYDVSIQAAYSAAIDPAPLASGFDQLADAQAVATKLLALHGTGRRRWTVRLGRWGNLFDVGDPITVDHPRLAGRTWIAIAKSEQGDNITATLWG